MLYIRINKGDVSFGLWKWKEADFKIPLKLTGTNYEVHINLLPEGLGIKDDRQMIMHANFKFVLHTPPIEVSDGLLKPNRENGEKAARYIHSLYTQVVDDLISYCKLELNFDSTFDHVTSYYDLFTKSITSRSSVDWSIDDINYKSFDFVPKKRRGVNPFFKSKNLLKAKDWVRLNKLVSKPAPSKEVRELLKLRSKINWNQKRIPVVEAAAIIEMYLKNSIFNVLLNKGLSKTKLENTKEEVGLSTLLNLMLALCLSKTQYPKLKDILTDIDGIRRIRNKIMHENLPDEEIDKEDVQKGINAAIDLILYLKKHPLN